MRRWTPGGPFRGHLGPHYRGAECARGGRCAPFLQLRERTEHTQPPHARAGQRSVCLGRGGGSSHSGMGSHSPPALCRKVRVREEALRPLNLEAPSPAGGHLAALGGRGSAWVPASCGGRPPGRRSHRAPATRLPDLASTSRRPPGSETLCCCFLRPRGAWSASERASERAAPAGAAARPPEGAPARGCASGRGWVPAVRVSGGGRGPRGSGSHSGNDDSERFRPSHPLSPSAPDLRGDLTGAQRPPARLPALGTASQHGACPGDF